MLNTMNITHSIMQRVHTFRVYLIRFAYLQLFLSLVSLPIMLAWGLPISLLSPLGNLLFGPVITLFLCISSLIFFSEILHIPNAWLITCLEQLTSWWLTIMHADNASWLVGFIKPSTIIMLAIPIITVFIVHRAQAVSTSASISLLTAMLVCVTLYLKSSALQQPTTITVPCNKGALTVLACNNQVVVIDPGYMGQRTCAASWAQYTLMPTIIQATGATTIDHLIVLQPGSMVFQALERLCITMGVKHIYLVVWQGEMSKAALRNYGSFMRTVTKKGIRITRIAHTDVSIYLGRQDWLQITPLKESIKSPTIAYKTVAVHAQIDKESFTIYSAKYEKKHAKSGVQQTISNPLIANEVTYGDQ
jgi:hypothetical protein